MSKKFVLVGIIVVALTLLISVTYFFIPEVQAFTGEFGDDIAIVAAIFLFLLELGRKLGDLNLVFKSKMISAIPPKPIDFFIGHEDIQKKIKRILTVSSDASTIALIGMGGIGKTALAKQIVNDVKVRKHFKKNIFWGDLYEFQGNSSAILRLWASYCDSDISQKLAGRELAVQVHSLLLKRSGPILIILDNLSQEWLEAGSLLYEAIPDDTPMLITTRETKVLQKFNVPESTKFVLGSLDESDACTFLFEHSGQNITNAVASEIAMFCGYIPLALEIAAKIVKEEGTDYLLPRMKDEKKRLSVLNLDDARRKDDSVEMTFAISYNSLPEDTKLIFRALGAFAPISILPSHVEAVLGYVGHNQIDMDAELRRLRRYSLMQFDSDINTHGMASYRMQALLHDYAKTLLTGAEEASARRSHYSFYEDFSHKFTNADFNEEKTVFKEFAFFYHQMRQALNNFGKTQKSPDLGIDKTLVFIEFVNLLDRYWRINSNLDEQIKWFKLSYEYANNAGEALKAADFARRVGRTLGWRNQLDKALEWMDRCEKVLEDNEKNGEENAVRALMYIHRASINFSKKEVNAAEADCRLGIEIICEEQHPEIIAEGFNLLGVLQANKGNLEIALGSFKKSLSVWKNMDEPNQYQIYRTEDNFRTVLYYLGNIAESRDAEDKSLVFWEQHPKRMEYAMALTNRGLIHFQDGELEQAIQLHNRSIKLSDSLGIQRLQVMARVNIAGPLIVKKKYDVAEAYLQESLKYENKEFEIDAIRNLAEIEIGRRKFDNAVELAEKALILSCEEGDADTLEEGAALRVLGQAQYLKGELKTSQENLRSSLTLLHDNQYKYEEYLTVLALEKTYRDVKNDEKLKEMTLRAETLRERMGLGLQDKRKISQPWHLKRSMLIQKILKKQKN